MSIVRPKVENFCGGVRVTFQRKSAIETTEKSTLKSTLKSTQKVIVEIISNSPNITIPKVAEQLGLNPRGVAKHFEKLQEQGIIRRVGPDKGGHWEVIE